MTMYVPTFQGLGLADFLRTEGGAAGYPFDAPARLSFYRARNAIYHLFKALRSMGYRLTVLAPDYNSGNEVLAMRAAGATIHYCAVRRDGQLDPGEVERLCRLHQPEILYVIHYLGWPQPIAELADLCRRRRILLVEDCALALLSQADGRPLGSFGDWSIFCLYKTLPVPNGALLVQNTTRLPALEHITLRRPGAASVAGPTAELVVQRLRARTRTLGAMLHAAKRRVGRQAAAMAVSRATVGDLGFDLDTVDLAMSGVSSHLLRRVDVRSIREARTRNFRELADLIRGRVSVLYPELPDGACPLFLPVLVDDKPATARSLGRHGIDALEFWNHGADAPAVMGAPARFLREHVLGLPVHQDLTRGQLAHVARHVAALDLRKAA
jgi:dTDP-4-amino-4,6-dideoxygalactose transaminase